MWHSTKRSLGGASGRRFPLLLGTAAAAAVTGAAAAQPTDVGEIVVTAQKRAENLQDVPLSVAAFSERQVEELGISRPIDVANYVPGLVAKSANGDNSPIFTVRGIGVTDFTVGNNSPTSVYVDQVVKPYYPMVNFSLFDIERVEVLKGPQGTLYGRNNTGGAIKFITRQPSRDPSAQVRLDLSRFETLEVEAAGGGPVTETLAVRLAAFARKRNEGWQTNAVTGRKIGEVERMAGRVTAQWRPSEALSATLTAYAGRNDSDVIQFKLAPPFRATARSQLCPQAVAGQRVRDGSCVDAVGGFDPDPNVRRTRAGNALGDGITEKGHGLALTLDWDVGFGDVTSVSGYDRQKRQEFQDFDAMPYSMADNSFTQNLEAFSQELRIAAKPDSAVQWIGGLFYTQDRVENLQILQGNALFGIATPLYTTVPWVMETEAYAAFGQVEVPLTDTITAIGGLRYTHEERTFVGGTRPLHTLFPTVLVDNEISVNDLSGKIGLNYEPTDNLLIYVSASKGFKSGGFNGGFATRAVAYDPYGPEELWAYEIGVKSNPTRNLRLNAAAFFYDWQDFQATVTRVDPLSNLPTQVLSNAGNAEIKGLEIEAQWRPVTGLTLGVTGNWTDHEIVSGIYEGRRIGNTPHFSLSGLARYETELPGTDGAVFALTDFSYRSRYPLRLVTPTTRALVFQDSHWLVNGRIGYRSAGDRWEASVWVKNVFDEVYLQEVFDQGTLNTLDLYAEPRTFGVTFSFKYQ